MRELAVAAGLTLIYTHRYYTNYLDHNRKTTKEAKKAWSKKYAGPMPWEFLTRY
jgi:hypothetical protein